jgi:tetratricopeptide (TPR) repeat protein
MTDSLEDNVVASAKSKIAKAEMAWGKVHPKVIKELANLADLYLVLGNYEEAEPIYWRILETQHKVLGPTHPDCADTLLSLGELHESELELSQAEQFYVAAQWILEHNEDHNSDIMARIFLKLYGIYRLTGNKTKIADVESRLYSYFKRESPCRKTSARLVPVEACAAVA